HDAIKEFFPKAQLFGFTGTPIFQENASYKKVDGTVGSFVTTKDVFQKQLHAYTITNAIDDGNVLRFHVDYYKPDDKSEKKAKNAPEEISRKAIVETILEKHEAATNNRRFNAIFATASINHAIEYYELFKEIQKKKKEEEEEFKPLNVVCVFSPPAEGNKDIQQIQEDLEQEKEDNKEEPAQKKEALKLIIKDYNKQYGTNHRINEFDLYYQDVQKRIKDQKYSNADYPHKNKIDLVIVVDMLLTGFDSKFLNTLYVDKNLKNHSLIQAFSRTNRVLNDTKPYGNILDFRQQNKEVDNAIALFSGQDANRSKEIWLVDPAPVVIQKLEKAYTELKDFMKKQGLECTPEEVNNLKGDKARGAFINTFKEVQRLKTQLDQYTDLTNEDTTKIENLLPEDKMRAFKGAYIETASKLKSLQGKPSSDGNKDVDQLDFEFVLFSSAIIDYDYIMSLIAKYTQAKPSKQKMTRDQVISILRSSTDLMEETEDIIDYINTLKAGEGLSEEAIKEGYVKFKSEKSDKEINSIATNIGLDSKDLKAFVEEIIERLVFDGEKLSDLLAPLELGWKERSKKEAELMN
ncbi:MAG: type I restriction endonuclease subunit R, partial [Leptospiraceae bacterium]|nr:type I restriction endonuclease subunit R [Leptospiraceae bacterium]